MPDVIKFALIPNKYIANPQWKLQQLTIELQVEGAENPLTHQEMRDELRTLWQTTQRKIDNELNAVAILYKRPVKVKEKTQAFGAALKRITAWGQDFEAEAQTKMDTFCKREAQKAETLAQFEAQERWRNIRWAFSTLWNAANILNDTNELAEKLFSTDGSWLDAALDFYGVVKAVHEAYQDFSASYRDETKIRKDVIESLKKLKSARTITESLVKQLEENVKDYETKVNLLELKTRALTAQLSKALSSVPSADELTPELQKQAESTLDKLLNEVTDAATHTKKAQEQLKKFKLKLGAARASTKKDSNWATFQELAIEWGPLFVKWSTAAIMWNQEAALAALKDTIDKFIVDAKKVRTAT